MPRTITLPEDPPCDRETSLSIDPREVRAVLKAGHLAPSVHNTQPWRFVLAEYGVEVHADESRRLAVIDPLGRALVMSCGAAILNMRVQAAALGRLMRVEILPDAAAPTHLATLSFGARAGVEVAEAKLAEAIHRRHTHRRGFGPGGVAGETLAALSAQAVREGARLVRLDERRRRGVARLTRVAELALSADPAYRREIQRWTTVRSLPKEGVPLAAAGTQGSRVGEPPLRDFAVSRPWFERAPEHFSHEEWLVVATRGDDRANWLAAGQALERVLLTATAAGLGASLMTQALEVAPIRAQLASYLGRDDVPQVLIRIGPATPKPTTARRPLDQVVTVGPGVASLLLR